MRNTVYIGTLYKTAEYIYHSDKFDLKGIICEKNRLSDEMYTFSLVRNVKLYLIESKRELVEILSSFGNEYVYIMYSFGLRIPMGQLKGFDIYNIHPSDLPRYKGAQPTYWATVNNEKNIGISMFKITENLDDGEIIEQYSMPYYMWENEITLSEKSEHLLPNFLEALNNYLENNRESKFKNREGDYYPKVTRKEVYIDLEADTPDLIFNKVRAEALFGGAKIVLGGVTYCLDEIVMQPRHMEEDFIVEDDKLLIRYRNDIVIKAVKYSVLQGEFKFRGEK